MLIVVVVLRRSCSGIIGVGDGGVVGDGVVVGGGGQRKVRVRSRVL